MRVLTQPCLRDNLSYLVHRNGSRDALVIDPSEAGPVLARLQSEGLTLKLILNTHHHHDHVGGNEELARATGAPVWCSQVDINRVPGASRGLADGEEFDFDSLRLKILSIPGHTRGQIAFHVGEALFAGDTVFALGCGRLLEGTPAEMFASLKRIHSLPPQTRLYFGHDYLERNAGFAASLFPGDAAVSARLAEGPSAPTLKDEERANPFFWSVLEPERLRSALKMQQATELELFTELRRRRDSY